MGLDMYLERYPRYKHFGPKDMDAVAEYRRWRESKEKYSFEEWCGKKETALPVGEDREKLLAMITERFGDWDKEKKYPIYEIYESVASWRKANAIHKWFVDNVQDGVDDCDYHREVTEEDLKKLIRICEKILRECVLVEGKVNNGYIYNSQKMELEPVWVDGFTVVNSEICNQLLPPASGFFFGSTDYDQYYIDDVKYTYDALLKALATTDFEHQMLYYVSSW